MPRLVTKKDSKGDQKEAESAVALDPTWAVVSPAAVAAGTPAVAGPSRSAAGSYYPAAIAAPTPAVVAPTPGVPPAVAAGTPAVVAPTPAAVAAGHAGDAAGAGDAAPQDAVALTWPHCPQLEQLLGSLQPGIVYMPALFLHWTSFSAHYKQHNAALKWFRMLAENDTLPVHAQATRQLCTQCTIGQISHPKGTDYSFNLEPKVPWTWIEMVSQMTDDSIEYVCLGPEGRSGGLTHAECSVRPGSYDHKRHTADYRSGQPDRSRGQADRNGRRFQPAATVLGVWDFALHRADGSVLRVHPPWNGTKIESMEMPPGAEYEAMQLPRRGVGQSDGRGTFRYYKTLNVSSDRLRFDPTSNGFASPTRTGTCNGH